MNCCVVPRGIVAVGGLIVIETSAAGVTVSSVEVVTLPDVAVMFAVPVPTLLAIPALLIVAVEGVSDDHVTVLVRFCVLPSVNVPAAANCCCVPSASEGVAGVMASDTKTAELTVSVVDPVTVPAVAVMVAVPCPTLLARPCPLAALLIVATLVVSELHCTVPVMFCWLPSVNVPVAVNCCVVPSGIVGIAGVTAIDTTTAAVTVSVVEPLIVPDVAVTLVLPRATLLASPCPLTVAMAPFPVLHVTVLVRFSVLPSL